MANVCIVRHQGYIKSKMRFLYQHISEHRKTMETKTLMHPLHIKTVSWLIIWKRVKPISLRSIVCMKKVNLTDSLKYKGRRKSKQSSWMKFWCNHHMIRNSNDFGGTRNFLQKRITSNSKVLPRYDYLIW